MNKTSILNSQVNINKADSHKSRAKWFRRKVISDGPTDRRTDRPTDGRTHPLIELLCATKKIKIPKKLSNLKKIQIIRNLCLGACLEMCLHFPRFQPQCTMGRNCSKMMHRGKENHSLTRIAHGARLRSTPLA